MGGIVPRLSCVVVFASIHAGCTDLSGLSGGAEEPNAAPATPDAKPEGGVPELPKDVVYVAGDGSDTNAGKDPKTPKRTIGAAIALLKTTGATKHEIHVCRGRYDESVTLDWPVDILGGYECSTWMRSVADNEVVVNAAADQPALTVKDVGSVVVDGLTLRGAPAGADRSRAVHVLAGASVVLSNDRILAGGGTTKLSPGSAGVFLQGGAVELRGSTIEGGAATNESGGYGSAGVYLKDAGSTLRVSSSVVRGGSGSVPSGTGSIGILALGGSVPLVESSTIHGGTGRTAIGSASIGVAITSRGDVDFSGNVVDGGAGSCTGDCGVVGASLAPDGRARVHANRITAGEVSATGGKARFTALAVIDAPSADVQNNQVFTGNVNKAITSSALGIEVRNAGAVLVAQNTVVLGPTLLGTASALAIGAAQATIANDLLVTAGGSSDAPVHLSACKDAKVVAFRNNVWAGFPAGKPLLAIDETDAGGLLCKSAVITAATPTEGDAALASAFAGAVIEGNAQVTATPVDLFGAWNKASANDLLARGWTLAPTAPCAVAKAPGAASGLAPTDAFGAPRTDPRSIGAAEADGACR